MTDLFDATIKVVEKEIVNLFIMFIVFLVISIILYGIFSLIIGLTIGIFFSYFVVGIEVALALIIFTWYIASLSDMGKDVLGNKVLDIMKSVKVGLNNIKNNTSSVIVIAVLGFIGGFIAQLSFGIRPFGFFDFGAYVIEGIFYAVAVGIALSEFVGKKNGLNFLTLFDKVNKISPNAGITLYIVTALAIIPGIGFLQGLIIGMPVIIILLFESGIHHNTQASHNSIPKKETNAKNTKIQK